MKLTDEQKQEIKIKFSTIENVEEFAELLTWVYNIKFPKANAKTIILITAKHLNYYAFEANNNYKRFLIKKKNGNNREIFAPNYKLKTIQKCINEILNAVFMPKAFVTGFVPNRSIVENAKIHINKKFVFNTDLKDFFPSTDFRRVKTVLGLYPFNLIDDDEIRSNVLKSKTSNEKGKGYLAFLIANLCCYNGFLPQGAPTSPTLTNIVCQKLDKKLNYYSKKINVSYTRYADDITFSANKPVFDETFKKSLIDIIEVQEKFKINFEKERLQSGGERQSVTGIIVNRKSNVDRTYLKDIRFWLMCWKKFGTDATQQKFLVQFPEKKGFLRYGGTTPQFYNYLNGKILFLGMVRGSKDEIFLKQKMSFDELYVEVNGKTNQISKSSGSISSIFELLQTWEKKGIETAIKQYGN